MSHAPSCINFCEADTQAKGLATLDIDNDGNKIVCEKYIRDNKIKLPPGKTKVTDLTDKEIIDIMGIDNFEPYLTPEDVKHLLADNGIDWLAIIPSFSDSNNKRKFRVFVDFDSRYDAVRATIMSEVLSDIIGIHVDSGASNDTSRLWFGSKGDCGYEVNLEREPFTYQKALELYKPPAQNFSPRAAIKSNELRDVILQTDFLSILKDDCVGQVKESGNIVHINPCPICGDDTGCMYNRSTNSYYCYSNKHLKGGTVFDYLMERDGIGKKEAAEAVYAINGIEAPTDKSKKPSFTIEILDQYMQDNVINISYDIISHVMDVKTNYFTCAEEDFEKHLATFILSELQGKYTGCNKGTINDFLSIILDRNKYNPVLDWIKSKPWDKKSRLQDVYDILHLRNDFQKLLFRKWAIQAVSILFNSRKNSFGAEGVLTFKGDQRIGKTYFLRAMATPRFFLEGKTLDVENKDVHRRVTSCWICELGELDSTMRKSIPMIKAFVTNSFDEFRIPYDRNDTKNPRHTVYAATCNHQEFLQDDTGNRRFWTLEIAERIDFEALDNLDVQQFWAEILSIIDTIGCPKFYLTNEENEELSITNKEFEVPLRYEREIEDIITMAHINQDEYEFRDVTALEFVLTYPGIFKSNDNRYIGKVFKKLGVEQKRTEKARLYNLPVRRNLQVNFAPEDRLDRITATYSEDESPF